MNIVVLCGGISTEREVSIRTGKMVCQALRTKGHNAIALDVYCGNTDIDVLNLLANLLDTSVIDIDCI